MFLSGQFASNAGPDAELDDPKWNSEATYLDPDADPIPDTDSEYGDLTAVRASEATYLDPDADPIPDTDSEYGDLTAVRATWRRPDGAAPPCGWPAGEQPRPPAAGTAPVAGAGGAARASEGSREPRPPAAVRGRGCRGRKARVAQARLMKVVSGAEDPERVTTVMVRNLPAGCKQDEVVHALNDSGFEGAYDFCYMPCDFASRNSRGVAFVNFKAPAVTWYFKRTWHGSQQFPDHSDSRPLQVTAAHIQGYEANLAMALKTLGSIRNPSFRRLVFAKQDPEFPSTGTTSLTAPPAARLSTAPPRFSCQAEAVFSQERLPMAPGMLYSACASPSVHPAVAHPVVCRHGRWSPQWPLQRPPGVFAR